MNIPVLSMRALTSDCMEWTSPACLMISVSNTPFRHEVRINVIINSDSFTVMCRCTTIEQFISNVVNPSPHFGPTDLPYGQLWENLCKMKHHACCVDLLFYLLIWPPGKLGMTGSISLVWSRQLHETGRNRNQKNYTAIRNNQSVSQLLFVKR